MNSTMHWLDWLIVAVSIGALSWFSLRTIRYMQGVADFLSANRSAGRYMLTLAGGMSAWGAISAVAVFEQYYAAGFPTVWWTWMMVPAALMITLTGWVFYRFRETRCLTLAQFFEVRYSRRFRIYAGFIVWLSGILNFGIFPYVASNFFVYFCGLPEKLVFGGMSVPTYWPIMLATMGMALMYTCIGGQITVMITDCVQGIFCGIALLAFAAFLLYQFAWSDVTDAMKKAPTLASRESLTDRALSKERLAADILARGRVDWEEGRSETDLTAYVKKETDKLRSEADKALAEARSALTAHAAATADPEDANAAEKALAAKAGLRVAEYESAWKKAEAERLEEELALALSLRHASVDEAADVERQIRMSQAAGLRAEADMLRKQAADETVIKAKSLGKSMLNPFDTGRVENFNVFFYLIMVFNAFYGAMSWQGSQAYQSSGISPHEQKMGGIIGNWRLLLQNAVILLLAVCALAFLTQEQYATQAAPAHEMIQTLKEGPTPQLGAQQRVPIALAHMLPMGLRGLFCVLMVFLLVTTQDTYMHSWGSIFIQDVVMPWRKKPLSPKAHVAALRWSIIGVAVFAFIFACLYKPTEFIQMYFAITGAIISGLGCAIVGGLYWKYGTAPAAYLAVGLGAALSITRLMVHQYKAYFAKIADTNPLAGLIHYTNSVNSQVVWFFIMLVCIVTYVVISRLTARKPFNMDRMLHRGRYDTKGDHVAASDGIRRAWLRYVGITNEFSKLDRLLAVGLVVWNFGWLGVFVVATIYNFVIHRISVDWWVSFWWFWLLLQVIIGVPVTVWFTIGGLADMKRVFHRLATLSRDDTDDGRVVHHHLPGDEEEPGDANENGA